MTKEELEKEAKEYASIHARQYCHNDANGLVSSYREVYNAYYQSAEPREKRIEELDKENGKLEGKLADLQSEYFELENFHHNVVNELKAQLTKANGLLLRFIELKNKPCAVGHSVNMLLYGNICAEAEQFLKEVNE